jgi:hypothetical protein
VEESRQLRELMKEKREGLRAELERTHRLHKKYPLAVALERFGGLRWPV